ncbi:MAG: chemotaxis protein [Candidatus Magnetoovum sp. WYHC-5]|nr:chemotaxis protein [Candidatus Magnetoovum sp. WYHC-5]
MAKNAGALPEVLKVGTNEIELVVFKMYDKAITRDYDIKFYGVNVAKVREIIPIPPLTSVPDMPEYADALAEVRGEVIPIINLGKWMKLVLPDKLNIRHKVIVVEMLGTTVGIVVHDVERIRRIKWDQIKPPPNLLQSKHGGKITGVTKLDNDETLLLILDLESIIQEIGAYMPSKSVDMDELKKIEKKKLSGNVLIVDDSAVARRVLRDNLENLGLKVMEAVDGKKGFQFLKDIESKLDGNSITDYLSLVISDVEMPEMDGLTFTKSVKQDPILRSIPIIINTSLSGEENQSKAKVVGADGYLIKFDVTNLIKEVTRFFK